MWKCSWLASTWLSLRTCLCREETPGLITPSPDTLLLLFCSLSLSLHISFFFLLLCPASLLPLPLPPPILRLKAGFFSSLPPLPLIFVSQCFFFPLPSSLPVCNWLFFCLWSPSFTLFILHSFSHCPFSRSFPFLAPLPPTPFFLCCFYVHVFEAVFVCICVSLSVRGALNTHMSFCMCYMWGLCFP